MKFNSLIYRYLIALLIMHLPAKALPNKLNKSSKIISKAKITKQDIIKKLSNEDVLKKLTLYKVQFANRVFDGKCAFDFIYRIDDILFAYSYDKKELYYSTVNEGFSTRMQVDNKVFVNLRGNILPIIQKEEITSKVSDMLEKLDFNMLGLAEKTLSAAKQKYNISGDGAVNDDGLHVKAKLFAFFVYIIMKDFEKKYSGKLFSSMYRI